MQGHQLHRLFVVLVAALAHLQCGVAEKFVQPRRGSVFLVLELGQRVGQLVEVFDPGLGALGAVLLFVVAGEVDRFEYRLQQLDGLGVVICIIRVTRERSNQGQESSHRVACPAIEPATLDQGHRGGPQGAVGRGRGLADQGHGAIADAACRHVDHAGEGGVIVGVGDQAQVAQRVLDLGALEEAQPTIDPVRHAVVEQRLLELTRLGVGSVQDCALVQGPAARHPLADMLDGVARLVLVVVGAVQRDRVAVTVGGP